MYFSAVSSSPGRIALLGKRQGVPQNYAEADAWYRKAAAQGYADAENNLGVAYYLGHGVPQNSVEAIAWLRKAAVQGYPRARRNLEIIETGHAGSG